MSDTESAPAQTLPAKSNGTELSYVLTLIDQLRTSLITDNEKMRAEVRELRELFHTHSEAGSSEYGRLMLAMGELATKTDYRDLAIAIAKLSKVINDRLPKKRKRRRRKGA